jgi:predicted metal-dependent peptidase
MEQWLKDWLDAHGLDSFDMQPGPPGEGDLSDELASRIWASRLARAQAGDRPGGLLRSLAGDFPISKTPWPQVLRSFMQDAVMPQSRENWNRPSRRTLASGSDIFEPATQPEYGIRRAGVVIDTSGSIDDALLMAFCAEVGTIQSRTGCEIVLLSADYEVQTEVVVKNDGRPFLDKVRSGQINFQGGGGTAFGPAISRLNRLKVSVGLYFTDLAGSFGDERPVMPLLWCSTSPNQSVPFGRVINIDSPRNS